MSNELNQILREIANIQVTSLNTIRRNTDKLKEDYAYILKYVEDDGSIEEAITKKLDFWKRVQNLPHVFNQVSDYDLGLSSHILFTMESEWVQDNPDGVLQCWDLINEIYKIKHPETTLIWKLKNLYSISRT